MTIEYVLPPTDRQNFNVLSKFRKNSSCEENVQSDIPDVHDIVPRPDEPVNTPHIGASHLQNHAPILLTNYLKTKHQAVVFDVPKTTSTWASAKSTWKTSILGA